MALKTYTIRNGENFILPPGSTVQSVITNGTINLTSSCGSLPSPQAKSCYRLTWASAPIVSANNALLERDRVWLEYITINNIKYVLHLEPSVDTDITTAFQSLTAKTNGLFEYVKESVVSTGGIYDKYIVFKTVPSIASTIELFISSLNGFDDGIYIKPTPITDC